MGRERDDLVVLAVGGAAGAHHCRQVGSVDISIDETDGRPGVAQRQGEVDGHRRLAHTALAAADRDDVLDAYDRLLVADALEGNDLGAEVDVDRGHIGDPLHQRASDPVADLVFERARGGGQDHSQRNHSAGCAHVADHAQLGEVLVELGVLDALERLDDIGFGDLGHAGV